MSGYISDRWIWLGLGVAFALGSFIAHVTTEPVASPAVGGDDAPTAETPTPEGLSLKTLRTLIDSPNPNISQMAIDLVHKRMHHLGLNAEVVHAIKDDAKSEDEDIRRKANTTLQYLRLDNDIPFVMSPTWSEASSSSPHDNSLWRGELDSFVIPSSQTPVAGWTAIPRERPPVGDPDVRRRRREAVVLHEGNGEVNEDDIIRPGDMHSERSARRRSTV